VLQSAVYDKGDFKLKIKRVDMHQRIDRAVSSLSIQARNKNIRIVRELDAPDPVIEADEVMVTNLIFNLVDNALKYFRPGDPYIAIRTRTEENNFVLEVIDNGIGISKDNQKRIFEKLYRVPTGNVHNVKGYGLGLSYVRSIVERHHGHIEVESQVGEGSTFRIRLPLKQHVFN
jgi:signal transduction histidine kinase